MKGFKEYDDEVKGRVLYDLLFNQKVKKLGNLDVTHHNGYVVVNTNRKKNDYKKNTG